MVRGRQDGYNDIPLGRLTRLSIVRTFVDAYHTVASDHTIRTRLQGCLDDLWRYPRPHGLNEEGLAGNGRHRFWSARINQNWRVIFLVPTSNEVILVYMGKHDPAYEWARAHVGDIDRLRVQASAVDQNLPIADVVLGFGQPTADELSRAAASATEFEAMCDEGIKSYFTTLDKSQSDLVSMDPAGSFLVLGGPGTGKTVIAIHRIARHLREGRRVAYVCFSRPLADATRSLITMLVPDAPACLLTVDTMHRMSLQIIKTTGTSHVTTANQATLKSAADDALRNLSPNLKRAVLTTQTPSNVGPPRNWSTETIVEEIAQVIMACHVRDLEAYLVIDRSWRGGQLTADARRGIWAIYEATTKALEARGLIAYDGVTHRAVEAIRDSIGPAHDPYAEIVIDEIQDVTPGFIELARLLLEPRCGRIFALGDPEQVLYARPIKLALDRVSSHRHDRRWLSRDYRSTRQNWRLAEAWRAIDRDGEIVREAEIAPERDGPAPCLVVEADRAGAIAAVVDAVSKEARTTPLEMISVLYLGDPTGDLIVTDLRGRGIPAIRLKGADHDARLSDPVVKVISMRKSKGLDFPSVFVLMPDQTDPSHDPITWRGRHTSALARRLLYVAATRASRRLVFVMSKKDPHPLLELLDPSSYRTEGTHGGDWRRRVGGEDAKDPDPVVDSSSSDASSTR
jgi:superfamily I DNA/RNA helicase